MSQLVPHYTMSAELSTIILFILMLYKCYQYVFNPESFDSIAFLVDQYYIRVNLSTIGILIILSFRCYHYLVESLPHRVQESAVENSN